jgi:hypothetical protein
MNDFRPFFIETYPLEELQARWKIVTDLCTYVVEGCRDQYDARAEVPHGEEFKNVVKAIMGEHLARLVEVPAKLRNRYCPVDNRFERVMSAFEEAERFSRYHIGACPTFSDKALLAVFKDEYGVDVIWQNQEGNPTCLGAFTNSLNNYKQACTRMCALNVIFELVRWSEHTNIYLAGAEQLRTVLYQRIRSATVQLAMFGGLLGGVHAKMATQILCHEMAYDPDGHTKFSAIQFLQPDGRVPGSWQATPENALAADIKARYEAL